MFHFLQVSTEKGGGAPAPLAPRVTEWPASLAFLVLSASSLVNGLLFIEFEFTQFTHGKCHLHPYNYLLIVPLLYQTPINMSDSYDPSIVQGMIRDLIYEAGPAYVTGLTSLCLSGSPLPMLNPYQTLSLLFWYMSASVIERSIHYVYSCLSDEVRGLLYQSRLRNLVLLSQTSDSVIHCIMVAFVAFCSRQRGLAVTPILRQRTSRWNLIQVANLALHADPPQLLHTGNVDTVSVDGPLLNLSACFTLSDQFKNPLHPEPYPSRLKDFYHSFTKKRGPDDNEPGSSAA